jgi:hypothetical protein
MKITKPLKSPIYSLFEMGGTKLPKTSASEKGPLVIIYLAFKL